MGNRSGFWGLALFMGIGGIVATATSIESRSQGTVPASKAPVEASTALTNEIRISNYALRPPASYDAMQPSGPEGMQTFAWKGAERVDGSSPYLLALIITAPSGETEMPSLEVALKQHLAGIERRRTEFAATKAEAVKINGIEFLRARWSGLEKASDRKMHGLIYVAVVGNQIVQLSSQDIVPHHQPALALAEAAVQTFKKR